MSASSKESSRSIDDRLRDAANYQNAGQLSEAMEEYQQLLALQPDHAPALHNLGLIASQIGNFEAAVNFMSRSIAVDPAQPRALNDLAGVFMTQCQWQQAEQCLRSALALKPGYADAHSNLGNALYGLGRLEEAADEHQKALKLNPKHHSALHNRGVVLQELGRIDEAVEHLRAALKYKHDYTDAIYHLSNLKKFTRGDPDLARMEKLAGKQPSADDRLFFALGKAYNDIGDYDTAFKHFEKANRLQRQTVPYDRHKEEHDMVRPMEIFSREFIESLAKAGCDSPAPVFIIGMPRSGTSLVEQIIDSHPMVSGAGELSHLHYLAEQWMPGGNTQDQGFPENLQQLTPEACKFLGEEYLKRLKQSTPEAPRMVDKMPTNFIHAGFAHAILPNARIIHCRRDAGASGFSCFRTRFAIRHGFTNDIDDLASYYRTYTRIMDHWRDVLPAETLLEVDYARLVTDPEPVVREMLEFLGLPWDENCLAFYDNRRVVRTASLAQVRQPMYTRAIEHWKHYEKHLAPLIGL